MRRVYFIRPIGMDGPIKIGCSIAPDGRMETLNTWAAFPLEIVAEIEGGRRLEQQFHAWFLRQHSHGEWFHWSPKMEAVIDAIRDGTFSPSSLPAPVDLRRITGNYMPTTKRTRTKTVHSDLIDAVGKCRVREAFDINAQVLHWWRVRGVPVTKRIAFAGLCSELGVAVPANFLEQFEIKVAAT